MGDIAAAAIRAGIGAVGGGGGIGGLLSSLLGGLLGAPGRATGGPVAPGRAYLVGERGPELFVPTSSGRVETGLAGAAGRDVRVSVTINAPAGGEARALEASSRQVARAVKAALMRVE
jgi:phage-related minor tail protein